MSIKINRSEKFDSSRTDFNITTSGKKVTCPAEKDSNIKPRKQINSEDFLTCSEKNEGNSWVAAVYRGGSLWHTFNGW